ncbi:MAG: NADH:flavin oxidoreductase, partial [Dehalococcoidia bacterium]|nr:NADH:flavin oxidoreductase [Dehalococcoidia bacterium]
MKLFESFRIRNLELKNRLVRSATWDATADVTGAVTDESEALYRELARGGVGLIITGYAFISASGQALHGQYGIHSDDMIQGLRRLVRAAHENGSGIALQIAHAGIGADYLVQKGLTPLAVSKITRLSRAHREMTDEDIEVILEDFTSATLRAVEAGFDAVQFHGAHGYLMSQFLSPLFNQRRDKWGGTEENRRRFHVEAIKRARRAAGSGFPLMIKLGVRDDRGKGLTLEEGLAAAQHMVAAGIDSIEASTGVGTSMQVMKEGEYERAYFRERAAAVKNRVSVPVIAVGGIRSPELAEEIIVGGDADMVAMCR